MKVKAAIAIEAGKRRDVGVAADRRQWRRRERITRARAVEEQFAAGHDGFRPRGDRHVDGRRRRGKHDPDHRRNGRWA